MSVGMGAHGDDELGLPAAGPDGTVGIMFCDLSTSPTGTVCLSCDADLEITPIDAVRRRIDPSLVPMCEACGDDLIEFVAGLPGSGGLR